MILLGLPCDVCQTTTVAHCSDAHCGWSRCPKCHSYGYPTVRFVEWRKEDYPNPYSLLDVEVREPEREFPDWLKEDYGRDRNSEA